MLFGALFRARSDAGPRQFRGPLWASGTPDVRSNWRSVREKFTRTRRGSTCDIRSHRPVTTITDACARPGALHNALIRRASQRTLFAIHAR